MLDLSKKRILVTGGAGFLGRHVIEKLKARGCADENIIVPRKKEYDLVDVAAIRRLYADVRPDVVIHLAAAVGGIGANLTHQAEYFYDNLMMGVQLMHEGYTYGIEKFVAVGTICAYPKFAAIPFKEDDIWNGYPEETNAPYGMAKKMMLVQSQTYRKQYGFNSIFLLPVNLYGPYDNFDLETSHVIPAIIRKVYEAKKENVSEIVLWGDGSPTREFLYVDDCAEGIVLATENYEKSDPVNIGAGFEISIKNLAEKIVTIMDYKGKILWDSSKPSGQPRRCLDVSRAKDEFDFMAQVGFEEGLKKTIGWYKNEQNWHS